MQDWTKTDVIGLTVGVALGLVALVLCALGVFFACKRASLKNEYDHLNAKRLAAEERARVSLQYGAFDDGAGLFAEDPKSGTGTRATYPNLDVGKMVKVDKYGRSLPAFWRMGRDEEDRYFYFNTRTAEVTHSRPFS